MSCFQQIQRFLFELKDDYGFIIPLDRLEQCLVCAKDITDLEEVFYRLQSMVCENEEQLAVFKSLFGQRFLKLIPRHPSDAADDESKLTDLSLDVLRRHQRSLDDKSKSLQKEYEASDSELHELEKKLVEAQGALETAKRKSEEFKASGNPYTDIERESILNANCPDLSNTKIQAQVEKLMNSLRTLEQAAKGEEIPCPVSPDGFSKRVDNDLHKPEYKESLQRLVKTLMSKASDIRDQKKMATFSALLDMISKLNTLISLAEKSISSNSKKDAAEMAKKVREYEKYTKNASATLSDLHWNIQRLSSSVEKQKTEQAKIERRFKDAQSDAASYQRELRRREDNAKLLVKDGGSHSHRPIFEDGVNAVQSRREVEKLMQTDLKQMSGAEKAQILSYIRTNARVFRQTLRRKYSSYEKRQVDIRATVKAAGKSGGEPVVIKYKKPVKSHAKVIILTDISGSCRRTASLALYFMALMDEAFPGGCKKFAFVNSLNPVDQFFRDKSPDEGIEGVLANIPTRGVYSDYGTTIHAFRQAFGGSIHQDTTIIILGDARNNQRRSYAEDIKYISDRCHKVFWLNSDDPEKWNQGDSVIGEYERAGAEVHHVGTVGELLGFLMRVK